MPVSEQPLVERIARVLAGAAHQQQRRRQRPVGRRQGRPGLARACEPGARRAAHHARSRRGHGRRGRCRDLAQDGRGRDRARRAELSAARRGEAAREPTRAGRWSPASSPPACPSSTARSSTSRCPRSAPATAPAPQRSAVGRQRLSAAAVRAAAARRRARRPLRAAAPAGHRHRPVRAGLAGLRAGAEPAGPACRAARRKASARRCCCPTAWPCSTPLFRARSAAARSASGPRPAPPRRRSRR